MNEQAREERLAKMRAYNKAYYQAHKKELSEKAKEKRREKLAAMTPEERADYNRKNAEYQYRYRREHPSQVAIWSARTWQRKVEQILSEQEAASL